MIEETLLLCALAAVFFVAGFVDGRNRRGIASTLLRKASLGLSIRCESDPMMREAIAIAAREGMRERGELMESLERRRDAVLRRLHDVLSSDPDAFEIAALLVHLQRPEIAGFWMMGDPRSAKPVMRILGEGGEAVARSIAMPAAFGGAGAKPTDDPFEDDPVFGALATIKRSFGSRTDLATIAASILYLGQTRSKLLLRVRLQDENRVARAHLEDLLRPAIEAQAAVRARR